ncbi:TPA: hypothetical protein ACGO4I_002325 [Streptococcus suis]
MIATEKNIIAIIESNIDKMTELEKEIARYFTQLDPVDADLTLEFTTATLHVSPSALTRFAKKCGFSGYREFVFTYQKDHQHLLKHFDHIQRSLTKHTKISSEEISDGREYSLFFLYDKVEVSC